MFRLAFPALMLATGLLSAQSLGKITGKITDAMTRQPIAKVHVGCRVGEQFVGVLSGPDGGYTLENVAAGEVSMTINLEGYKLISDNSEASAGFQIAAGDTVTRDFAMHPLGRIYGRLRDRDSGKPIEGHTVVAARRDYVPGHVYYMSTRSEPNDGEFTIPNLEAGDYLIEIESEEARIVFPTLKETAKPEPKKLYGQRWYPDVPRREMAATIHLGEGESRRLDISLESRETHTVSGMVVAPRELEHEPVALVFRSSGPPGQVKEMPAPGPFRIEDLAPGSYQLTANAGKPPYEWTGDYQIEISDHDIENFKATLLPEAGIRGEIRMLEDGVKAPESVGFSLVPTSGWVTRVGKRGTLVSGPNPGRAIRVEAGRFQMDSIRPGQYWPQVTLPEGYVVVEMRFEGASAQNNAMTLSAPDTPLTIVLTSRPGAVGGVVRNEEQTPVRRAMVALLPDPLPEKISPTTVRFAESGEGGEFVFKDVAPGRYRAVILNGNEDVREDDAELRGRVAKVEPFEMRAGQSASVTLKR